MVLGDSVQQRPQLDRRRRARRVLRGATRGSADSNQDADPTRASLATLLGDADYDTPVREISGYAADVTHLWGRGFALLGNAGEFLDPVFSSGVTIAMKSAFLATRVLHEQLSGKQVDWDRDYALPLRRGIDTFRAFVDAWYDGRFQDVVFFERQQTDVKRMIASILAGYAWDESNPYVQQPRRLDVLARLCRG
jgi:flavin-dependent dehydrogenase